MHYTSVKGLRGILARVPFLKAWGYDGEILRPAWGLEANVLEQGRGPGYFRHPRALFLA
jgi:hypothetical protein